METRIALAARTVVVAFLVLAGWLTYWQVFARDWLLTQPSNRRMARLEQRMLRGAILDRHGRPLAVSSPGPQGYRRRYPGGAGSAQVVGYLSERYGRTGLEAALDRYLAGMDSSSLFARWKATFAGRPWRGETVLTTLDLDLQQAAYSALGERRGAVVALDPATGEILALASHPSFDPGEVERAFPVLREEAGRPLLDRATQGLYPPGSAFKVVVSAAALQEGVVRPASRFNCPGSVVIHGYRVRCFRGEVHGSLDFTGALVHSCNCTFAQLAVKLGRERLWEYARRFGFGERFDLPVPASISRVADQPERLTTTILAQTGFGQGETVATPLQMAQVAAVVANGGVMMAPRLIRQVRSPDGRTVRREGPVELGRVISGRTARTLREMMVQVVRRGTGVRARIAGVEVAAKTGTAQNPHGGDHAWMIAFATAPAWHGLPAHDSRAGRPRHVVAVAVLLEGAGQGGQAAAPVARKVLEAALGR